MSNQAVGQVYHAIIEEVINSSRVDFEEGGVDDSVLEELRRGWQRKLSQLDVASFPWDPKSEPATNNTAPAASASAALAAPSQPNPQYSPAQLSPQVPPVGLSLPTPATGGPPIKQEPSIKLEPGVQNGQIAVPQFQSTGNAAWQRAQQNLQQQYGHRAANSIGAIQAGSGQAPRPALPMQNQAGQPANVQQYRQGVAVTQQQRAQALNAQSSIKTSQTDGAGDEEDDFEGVLMQRDGTGNLTEMGRVEIDRMIHSQIAARAKAMEGGGLMLPLKEATRHPTAPTSRIKAKAHGAGGYDGNLEGEDEDDEDAINSDLDDSDDQEDDEEGEEETLQHVMLCMYDKVQRVKNKWKCTLKDGVLTVNGKEYVFHKATGEYEW